MFSIRASFVAAFFGLAICASSTLAVSPAPLHQCGTFVSYSPPSATTSGILVIGSTTYRAAWMGSTGPAGSSPHSFNQVISNGVTAGSPVCLDGTLVNNETEGSILTDFTVSAASGSQLPSTSTGGGDPTIPAALLAAGIVAVATAMRIRRTVF